MAEEGKKISFGFSKSIKKTALKNVPPPEQKKVDYIDCVDEKSIKIVGGEEKKDEPLVIPMLGSKTWHERRINKVDADVFKSIVKEEPIQDIQIKREKVNDLPNDNASDDVIDLMEISEIKKEPHADPLTLDEQAAREIIADINSNDNKKNKEQNAFTVPLVNDDLKGKEESSLEDYENIPINAFGTAMLRGMGWKSEDGINKNGKLPPSIPELRPKGLGLGANPVVAGKVKAKSSNENEQLKLIKGSYAKITGGKYDGSYGKVESFDDDSRVIFKLALGNEVISVNEFWVKPVSSDEYSQNSKVLNVKKYEEYKNKEANNKEKLKKYVSKNSECEESVVQKSKHSEKSRKKSKKKKYESSDDDNSVNRKSKKRRDSPNDNDNDQKKKKLKKLKKHKNRDSSSERLSRKNKKKDKEHEKTKQKKSDDLQLSKKSKNKNNKRSRSKSNSSSTCKRSRSRSNSSTNCKTSQSRSKSPGNHRSRSRSKSRNHRSSPSKSNFSRNRRKSRSVSDSPRNYRRSQSRSTSPRNHIRSRSKSYSPRNHRRSRSRSKSSRNHRSRSRSKLSRKYRRSRSRSKSSRNHRRSRSRSNSSRNYGKNRTRSRSPRRR